MSSDTFDRHAEAYEAAVRRHDERAAEAAMKEIVTAGEQCVAFLKRAAWLDMRQQDYPAAEAKFRTLSVLIPGAPDIARPLASAVIEQGDSGRALGMLREIEANTRQYEDLA